MNFNKAWLIISIVFFISACSESEDNLTPADRKRKSYLMQELTFKEEVKKVCQGVKFLLPESQNGEKLDGYIYKFHSANQHTAYAKMSLSEQLHFYRSCIRPEFLKRML